MLRPLTEIVRDPALRLSTLLLVLNGAIGASLAPYQSLLAIRLFGLTDRTYALVLVAGAAVFVVASLVLGILSDLHFARRSVALATATAPIGGFGLMTALPGPHAFVLVHAVLLPIGATLFAQCFALARVGRQLEAARVSVWKAVWMADHHQPNAKEASMSKAIAGQAAIRACIEAIEICGAEGSIAQDHQLLEKWFRDIKVYDIFEGTGQIQRIVISKRLMTDLKGF